jgi:IS5 family transposase
MGLRLKHRQTVLVARIGECGKLQVEISKIDADIHRRKVREHTLSHLQQENRVKIRQACFGSVLTQLSPFLPGFVMFGNMFVDSLSC